MLIMRGSYRAQGLFARPICHLAHAIGSDNRSWGLPAGASGAVTSGCSDKKTLHCVGKAIGLGLTSPYLFAAVSVQTDPPDGSILRLNARSAAAAPKRRYQQHH